MRQREREDLEDDGQLEALARQALEAPGDRVDEQEPGQDAEREQERTQVGPQHVARQNAHAPYVLPRRLAGCIRVCKLLLYLLFPIVTSSWRVRRAAAVIP